MKLVKALSLKECCSILGVPLQAELDEVKRAYRKLAFALHPDLNPDDEAAKKRFLQVNEAYVQLIRKLSADQEAAAKREAEEQARREQEERERERKETERRERQELERLERERREKAEREKRAEERLERIRKEQEKQEQKRQSREETRKQWEEAARLAFERQAREQAAWEAEEARKAEAARREDEARKAREEEAARQEERKAAEPRPESHRRTYARPRQPEQAYAAEARRGQNDQDKNREALLRDILSDPKAREVYEELYQANRAPATNALKLPWLKGVSLPGLGGGVEAVKNWLRGQIDEEQVVFMPAAKLIPGARIRLQIRQGISQELRTVEVVLPPDFAPGKPVRLKGMGKKVGRWLGDFYIVFQAK